MKYYIDNANEYAKETFNPIFADNVFIGLKKLVELNTHKSTFLDIGCGSGRDAANLISKGFSVTAFDQSPEMIEQAKKLTKLDNTFHVGSAQNFTSSATYDFAYSIACLLHLDDNQFKIAINNIFKHINAGGYFYFTVKQGEGEFIDNRDRYFNFYNEDKLKKVISELKLDLIDISFNSDHSRQNTTWINVLVRKPS